MTLDFDENSWQIPTISVMVPPGKTLVLVSVESLKVFLYSHEIHLDLHVILDSVLETLNSSLLHNQEGGLCNVPLYCTFPIPMSLTIMKEGAGHCFPPFTW